MYLLEAHGVVTIPAVGMPGCSPAMRFMLYPDGERFGAERIPEVLEEGLVFLGERLDDPEAAGAAIFGPLAAETVTR
jgi:L-seryl-tRNA(Ser) seleniumtransferase